MGGHLVHFLASLEVGGKERVALRLARRASAAGWRTELVLFDAPYRGAPLDLDPGDLPVDHVPRRPGLDARLVRLLARRWRSRPPDVLHAHNDTAVFYACAALRLARLRGVRVCATFHTRPGHDTSRARLATRWAARRADHVTAVSRDLAGVLLRDRWVERCAVVPNGIDRTAFSPSGPTGGWRARLGVGDAPLVLHLARLDRVKRHVDLLSAASLVWKEEPSARFLLVGQGPSEASLAAASEGLAGLLRVPHTDDVAALMREVDLVVLCSDHEALPLALLEAMACARPIVATRVGGIPELLGGEDGAGLLVPPRDPRRLAEALLRSLRSPELRAELGRRGRVRSAAFDAAIEWERWRALYEGGASVP